jgi:hypothetical protein
MEVFKIMLIVLVLLLIILIAFWFINNKLVKSIEDGKGVMEKEDSASLIN